MTGGGGHVSVALIGHFESYSTYATLLNAARGADLPQLSVDAVRQLVSRLPPRPLFDVRARSPRGPELLGRYIDMHLVIDDSWTVHGCVGRVRAACRQAASTGARLVALGGFSSIVGEVAGLDPAREFGCSFTTGNTLTAAVVAAQVAAHVPRDARLAVVGAGGDVGSGVARILASAGYLLMLVGRASRPLEVLKHELGDRHAIGVWEDVAHIADAVVLVASTARGAVDLRGVSPGTFVFDAGHPPNARPLRHTRYAVAGRVVHDIRPECDLPAISEIASWPGESHACLAEAEVLGFEGRWEPYSRGRGFITPNRATEILALALRHGIHPARLHFETEAVTHGEKCDFPGSPRA